MVMNGKGHRVENYTKGECLGTSCRFYQGKPDATCFKQGVLPQCSPNLKAGRKRLDEAAPELYKALKSLPEPEFVHIDGKEYMAIPYVKFARWDVEQKSKAIAKAERG